MATEQPTSTTTTVPGADARGWGVAAAGAAVFFVVAARRVAELHAGASDLGIFDQAVWSMAHGRAPFVTTIGIDVFADHVSAVLLAFVPLYRLVASPLWLIGAQSICLGLTVVPARRLADTWGVRRGWATLLVLANPFVWSAAVYDVHPVVFATPAVAWLLLAVRRDDRNTATVASVLIALCRADTIVVLLGAALISGSRMRRRLLWLVPVPLVVSQVVPHVLGTWQTFDRYYGRLGASPVDALTHPWRVALLVPTGAFQLATWLLPVGFLPLRRPRWVAALVVAGLPLLLSSWPGIAEPWWHHGVTMVPFVVAGAFAAMSEDRRRILPVEPAGVSARTIRTAVGPATDLTDRDATVGSSVDRHPATERAQRAAILVGTVAALVLASPFAPWAPPRVRMADVVAAAPQALRRVVAVVGADEPVSTSNEAAARLAHRDRVYIFPCPFPDAPGSRRCTHHDLLPDAGDVDLVVLPGDVDLAWLPGRWTVRHVDGITVARRRGG